MSPIEWPHPKVNRGQILKLTVRWQLYRSELPQTVLWIRTCEGHFYFHLEEKSFYRLWSTFHTGFWINFNHSWNRILDHGVKMNPYSTKVQFDSIMIHRCTVMFCLFVKVELPTLKIVITIIAIGVKLCKQPLVTPFWDI